MTFNLSGPHWRIPLLVALASGVAAGSWHYTTNLARLGVALDNLHECVQLATEIRAARNAPQRASLETRSLDDLGTVVEKAAADARLARDRVLRIDPQAPRRLGKTDYLEQATEVELAGVALRQLVEFIYNVAGRDDQIEITTLRLRSPHDSNRPTAEESWLADVVLTQRIYAPTTPHR